MTPADAHSPWQRGSHENINSELCRHLPKGTSLYVHPAKLRTIQNRLNNRPMPVLLGATPEEAYTAQITNMHSGLDPAPTFGELLMNSSGLRDGAAKGVLKKWSQRTRIWGAPNGKGWWLCCRPTEVKRGAAQPSLHSPGANLFRTQPDGLWAWFGELNESVFVDVIVIEVCGGVQNLNDKRARYMPATSSLVLNLNRKWFETRMQVQRGGKKRRIDATGGAAGRVSWTAGGATILPVRHLRVLYAIPDDKYIRWKENHPPTGYEYFCRHSSLKSYNSQRMQEFLKRMSITSQYYT